MSSYRVRRPGARVDFDKPLTFSFDGQAYDGFAGDTLASALLANGTRMLARSFKYGRPRGIIGTGPEEPNALMQIETGAHTIPNLKATQVELYDGLVARRTTGWPTLEFDLKSLGGLFSRFMPAGFYYKTFQNQKLWPKFEHIIRQAAGYGSAPSEPDPETYDHSHRHAQVVIVGGGASGLLAALLAGRAGLKVVLLDEQNECGGWLLSSPHSVIGGEQASAWLKSAVGELQSLPNVQVLTRTSAFALHDMNLVLAVEQLQDHLPIADRAAHQPRQRLHRIRAERVVLATGAIERPLVFGNNDVPGIMTASALTTYLNRYGVAVGKRILLQTSNDHVYQGAADLARAGCEVVLADTRTRINPAWEKRVRAAGVDVRTGFGIAYARGRRAVTGAQLVKLDAQRNVVVGSGPSIDCDALGSSGGLSPTVHLYCHDGGRPHWDEERLAFVVPEAGRAKSGIYGVGAVTGEFGLQNALEQTERITRELLSSLGKSAPTSSGNLKTDEPDATPARRIFRVPDGRAEGHGKKAFVDFQNDVSAADIHLAVRENYRSIEHIKRYTALGFGTDQGKLSNVNGFAIAADVLGKSIPEVGTTTYRPAYSPVTFGTLAGAHAGDTFEPRRYSPMQAAHVARGAEFEPVGQWLRPWYFPQTGEDLHAAVRRECLAARRGVGIMDASTLGKIDLRGKDVREFLNRVYANAWTQLAPGKCRYGLMLDENGMVMDDGVTACVADNHFLMTTTTGGAARVMTWLEKWHQTEWPDLDVYMTSVTDHWATAAVVGPKSRQVLAKICSDIDLSPSAFKFMDWREGTVAGVPARVFRISFSGELAFEVNVDANYGHHVWEALMDGGREFDITPYGTETMHVLRAEKGFIIVGQDTDGSMTPLDLDMAWAVGMKKPFSFIGKRSFARSDTAGPNRKQLVGLLTDDPQIVLAEGAQVIERADVTPPAAMLGHVTSSYYSPELGRSIALAVVRDGIARRSEDGHKSGRDLLYAYAGGKAHKVTVVSPVFVDPKGDRQNV
ncbi:sarcosine oxidase subunit alpha family protein [Hyphomicrobium facile]|uniref:Sarcosine oxidase subunit alpha n=1 Tax=Hyphomicrobium facile TaxID=51670 RepID=A0A1I7NBQ5_9HYPH|nr:sarcosine oxidase subunit alpha family protein [Hyphomicrobium facile]SFV32100.1 sarcosine oxidase subunit alpha [Hyphomicrobium facile]